MTISILLIDDNEVEHRLLGAFLNRSDGLKTDLTACTTLDGAVNALQKQSFDVIFLDDRLHPHKAATETLPAIRRLASETPIYIISASIDGAHLRKHMNGQVAGVIDKFNLKRRLDMGLLDELLVQPESRRA